MRFPAASSTAVRDVLTGPAQPAGWLGATAYALYLITRSGTVLAILTHDAVRLPCALVLPTTAAELPLTRLVAPPGQRHGVAVSVGAGHVEWAGPSDAVTVAGVREWTTAHVAAGTPEPGALAALAAALAGTDIGVDAERVAALVAAVGTGCSGAAVAGLLGRGPGLTPSGDDVLAGFLLGARAFGCAVPGTLAAVARSARDATSALSAQLLEHAARGECIAEVAAVVATLVGRPARQDALARLLAVGHTSGAALAVGLACAAARVPGAVTVGGTS